MILSTKPSQQATYLMILQEVSATGPYRKSVGECSTSCASKRETGLKQCTVCCSSHHTLTMCHSCNSPVCHGCMSATQKCCFQCMITFPVWTPGGEASQPILQKQAITTDSMPGPICTKAMGNVEERFSVSAQPFWELQEDAEKAMQSYKSTPLQNSAIEEHVIASEAFEGAQGVTLMLCNLPCKLSAITLARIIHDAGFHDKCEVEHVPCRRNRKGNRSYAFIQFNDVPTAKSFASTFTGFRFPGSAKIAYVKMAHVQGPSPTSLARHRNRRAAVAQ